MPEILYSDRQLQIIENAIEILGTSGVSKLTIKNIAQSIGISEPAIYRHFSSKFDILCGILDYFRIRVRAHLKRIVAQDGNAVAKLEAIFYEHFHNFTKKPAMTTVIFSEEIFRDEKRLGKRVAEIMDLHLETMRDIIRSGQKKGEIRGNIAAPQLALMLLGSLRLQITRWRLDDFRGDLIAQGGQLWREIKKMILVT